ncbi:hypothetical protein V9L05_22670 (plasmid) [Bernardetia sp. Wsw4-3y2]|uniref:hypothetical protein n=1 Tax=Bernardetia sp. Wsw4-3y2 TaxID=3127471 RepID=UPI0030D5159C
MKKAPLYILLLLLFCSSCSKKMYYAYEDEHSYCTIEATPKQKLWWMFGRRFDQVIYRAASKEHYDTTEVSNKYLSWEDRYSKKKDNIYMYIKNSNYNIEKKVYIDTYFDFLYIQRNYVYRYDFCLPSHDNSANYATYTNAKDSLIVDYIRYDLDTQYCFSHQGIDWFPPYFVRVKKIDYAKFNVPEVKYKYLKNPEHRNAPFYNDKWEDEQKKNAKKEEKRKERKQSKNSG